MEDDWRLRDQEKYLKGVTLYWKPYKRYSEKWDHDHCDFCMETLAEPDLMPEALHEGYATSDDYYWICEKCYEDFKQKFEWKVIRSDTE